MFYISFAEKQASFSCAVSSLCSGLARAWSQAHFGKGSGRVWLDEVRCTGNELTLEQCPKSAWGEHNCLHSEDAGVSCNSLTGRPTHLNTHFSYPRKPASESLQEMLLCIQYNVVARPGDDVELNHRSV